MGYKNIKTEDKDGLRIILIDRPSKLNALNKETINELSLAFKDAENNSDIKVIIISGGGTKAFIAGADISEFADFNQEQGKDLSKEGHDHLFDLVENLTTPVIAAINGFALGGGLELAMSAHFRVASDNAKMGLPETSLGVIPGYGGTQRLTQLVGKGKAMEMIMTAGMLTATEAEKNGLVNYVVTQEELIPFCEKIASKIMKNSPIAISSAIKAINASTKGYVNGFEVEIEEFGKCFATNDFKEGTSAFLEKRKAEFKGN
jgi:enoyl-CoA hydratase